MAVLGDKPMSQSFPHKGRLALSRGKNMRTLLANLVILTALVTAVFIIRDMVGQEAWTAFWTWMVGDFPVFYDTHLREHMPGLLTHPLVLLSVATIVILMILRHRR